MPILDSSTVYVEPECRYGHGYLHKVQASDPHTKKEVRFAWISTRDVNIQFVGSIFCCLKCGYTEFFDDEPGKTARTNTDEEDFQAGFNK